MEGRWTGRQGPADDKGAEAVRTNVKALFMDLYDYFRMDSGIDSIILFEHLCCVLIRLSDEAEQPGSAGKEPDPVPRYQTLINRCNSEDDRIMIDPFAFRDRPKLIRRILDTADKALAFTQNKQQLVPPLFDLLEAILRSRRNAALETPFPTAREIVRLACQAEQTALSAKALDPACGDGAFLLAVLEQMEEGNVSFSGGIAGLERDEHLRNCVMLMARFYHRSGHLVTVADGGSPVQIEGGTYDLILANPPFLTQSLRDRNATDDNRELPVPTKDVHRAFLQRTLLGLKPGGESAIIVPDSFLSHTGPDAIRVRNWIVTTFRCRGIVKLPAYTFYPQSMVNASVLFLRRPFSYEQESRRGIFFFTAELDGSSNDTRRLPVPQNDFDELRQLWNRQDDLWQEWCRGPRTQNVHGTDVPVEWNHPHFWFGRPEDIRRNDYSLLPEQYQPLQLPEQSFEDPEEILGELQKLGQEITELMRQLAEAKYDR